MLQSPADGLGQLVRPHGCIGVADAPELLRITQVQGRDVVETVSLDDHVFLKQCKSLRRRAEPPANVDDGFSVGDFERRRLNAVVAACGRKQRQLHSSRLQYLL